MKSPARYLPTPSETTLFISLLLLGLGIIGVLPGFSKNIIIHSYFSQSFSLSIFRIICGLWGITHYLKKSESRIFLKSMGIIYTSLGLIGILSGTELLFWSVKTGDNLFHAILAVISIAIGWM